MTPFIFNWTQEDVTDADIKHPIANIYIIYYVKLISLYHRSAKHALNALSELASTT